MYRSPARVGRAAEAWTMRQDPPNAMPGSAGALGGTTVMRLANQGTGVVAPEDVRRYVEDGSAPPRCGDHRLRRPPGWTLLTMLAVGISDDSLSADFHHGVPSDAMLAGRNTYPPADFDPTSAPNFIWPPLVAYLVAPLTLLPLGVADVVMLVLGLVCIAASLWLVGLRDWRVCTASSRCGRRSRARCGSRT